MAKARRPDRRATDRHTISAVLHRIVYLGVTLALGYGLVRLLSDPSFQLSTPDIRGARYLSQSEVVTTADIVGANIFRVSTVSAMSRLMELGIPEDAAINLRLPNKVTIMIDERPAAYLWKSGHATFAVSDDGTVLGPPTTDHPSVLVIDTDARTVVRGQKVDVRLLRTANYLVRTLPSAAGFTPGSVDVSGSIGASVVSPDGITIVIGDDSNLASKVDATGPTLFAARRAEPPATTIDLRFAGHPVFR